jgi:tetratricopeptide (TPR) repeat protein
VQISAISGMGGIGKSELALQYAYQHVQQTYPGGVLWVKAREDIGLQILDFARFYAGLVPPTDLDIDQKVRWCWKEWRDAATLIVFDDVQQYADIEQFLPRSPSQFRMLLASRSKFPPPVRTYEIKVLSELAAIRLLGSFSSELRLRVDADLATAKEICLWLGYLPLGLELVGRYLAQKPDLTLAKVWSRLQAQRLNAQALQSADPNMTATLGVIAAFELSWQELSDKAKELAARLSLFALAEVPWQLVADCLSEWDREELEDLRDRELCRASLLTRTGQGMYELHQLLREFFAIKLVAMDKREEFTIKFAEVLTAVAKTIDQIVTVEQQTNLKERIPHLVAATEFAQYLPDNDKTWCCTGLARFYQATSQFTTVKFWYQKALAIREKEQGANHPDTATNLNNLAALYESTGRYTEAELLYVRSLAIKEKEQGANHPDTATSLNNLAGLYGSTGRYAEAESLYVRSLAIREKELGANHPDTAGSLNNLAALYESTGRYAEAEPLYVRSLSISEEQLGANHPSTAISLSNLAGLYKSTGRYAEAEPLYVRSLSIMEKELGANHPDTATSLNNLAGLYESIGRYTEAEPLYVRSLAINEQELGANHPSTATSLSNLALLYYSIGRYAEAEPLYLQAVAILEQSLGINHPNTQTCIQNLQILRQQSALPQQQPEQPRLNWWQRLRGKIR